jgi:hypothetical protein
MRVKPRTCEEVLYDFSGDDDGDGGGIDYVDVDDEKSVVLW